DEVAALPIGPLRAAGHAHPVELGQSSGQIDEGRTVEGDAQIQYASRFVQRREAMACDRQGRGVGRGAHGDERETIRVFRYRPTNSGYHMPNCLAGRQLLLAQPQLLPLSAEDACTRSTLPVAKAVDAMAENRPAHAVSLVGTA